jgi:hypothetical protein
LKGEKAMKKSIIAIIVVVVIIALAVVGGVVASLNKGNENTSALVKIETTEDMENVITSIYEKSNNELYGLETMQLDLSDEMTLTAYTGLTSNENIENVVVSESMITSRAYSLVLVKVTDNADVEAIKKEMVDNIDMSKWICVTAEVVYATNYDNLIFLVMSSDELAKPQYDAFKEIVGGQVGKELVRQSEEF